MVLVRLAYVADLPVPAELVALAASGMPAPRRPAPPRRAGDARRRRRRRARRRAPVAAARRQTIRPAARCGRRSNSPRPSPKRRRARHRPRRSRRWTRCRRALPRSSRCSTNGARRCCARISRAHVHLVHFEPGRIEFRPADGAPRDLANRLGQLLERMDRHALADRGIARPRATPTLRQRRKPARRANCGTRWPRTRWCGRCSKPFPARRSRRCASALPPRPKPATDGEEPGADEADPDEANAEEDET